MVVYIAWFSSVTHLSALTFLRAYLAKHFDGRLWRLALLSVLLILLFVAVVPTGHIEFLGHEGFGAKSIDLGLAIYPENCDDFRHNDSLYYLDRHKSYDAVDAELLINGTLGLKNCTISNAPVFSLERPEIVNSIPDKRIVRA
ncbi:hypothetical protein CGRA01v4_07848 [Colletotrichum graminicola]|nr:hypothetical protein CGRA01v4_07848 [Colletotrichum graminicola]